jgi:hypothetical protein
MSNKNLKVGASRNTLTKKPATKKSFAKKDYPEKIRQDSEELGAPLENRLGLLISRTKKLTPQIPAKKHEMQVKESLKLSQSRDPGSHKMDINAESEIDSLKIENHFILQQLFEAQEEIERQLLSIRMDENKSSLLVERFQRLLNRYKNYVDYKYLTIVSVDQSTTVPVVHWKLSDVLFAGTAFDEILFNTVLKDGQVGIYIATMTPSGSKPISFNPKAILYPTLFNSVKGQQQVLRSIQYDHWHAFGAAVAAIDLCIRTHWRDVNVTNDFDRPFWGSTLSSLQSDFSRLPKVFRFARVSLKQELINSDYEHIWLEVFNINFGNTTLPKFEFRISASEIKSPMYSLLPKMEFPLIDGKTPPFDSWYPESFDDFGSKLEIRFNLGSKKFDIGVWSSLSKEDREFLLAFFAQIPRILSAIPQSEVPKHRDLEYWLQFTKEAVKIIQKYVLNSMSAEMGKLRSPKNHL